MSELLCPNFLKFCLNFRQIKTSGGALAPWTSSSYTNAFTGVPRLLALCCKFPLKRDKIYQNIKTTLHDVSFEKVKLLQELKRFWVKAQSLNFWKKRDIQKVSFRYKFMQEIVADDVYVITETYIKSPQTESTFRAALM